MNKLFHSLFLAVLAALVLSPGAAYAASLKVAVRQVNPDSTTQTVTCEALKPGCVLPFVINAGQSTVQSLDIHVAYVHDKLVLTFQVDNKYFHARDAGGSTEPYNTLWFKAVSGNAPATYKVTLFQPLSLGLFDPKAMNATHSSVATLEIIATPVP